MMNVRIVSQLVTFLVFYSMSNAFAAPTLNKAIYHTWPEVETYLQSIADDPELEDIVELIPIGFSREGKLIQVLQISKEGLPGKSPDTKPATLIMGAHHAREHVSKEAVLALIDKLIHGYGKPGAEGSAITYLVDAGTFYLLPWVNPDGGMHQFYYNPEQRKTNYEVDEPQIGAAACETCGDYNIDEDSPDITNGDVGVSGISGSSVAFANNKIISRFLQLWFEDESYDIPVLDDRVARIQPSDSPYTFNYEGSDPDADGLFNAYSGEDFVGGTDPNRNYGSPTWGDCTGNEGCSFLSGAQTYCGPDAFSEPETFAVAGFMLAHPNIGTLESLHSGVNEIYPPWWLFPDDDAGITMDQSYQDSVAQYISKQTGYEVLYGGQYAVNGDTTGYTYIGSGSDPDFTFWPGGLLSFTTEIYGMGSDSGSAEAIRDWFPHNWQQFDTSYPQGIFITWSDFPWCTTCNPEKIYDPEFASLPWYNYTQYTEYFIFNSNGRCGGENAPEKFHCDYWGVAGNTDYYADMDIFAYFNPPAANRCYQDWNCDGKALVRTVNRQLKHLLYRLYISPFIKVSEANSSIDTDSLEVAIENTGFLRSSIMTTRQEGDTDPFIDRTYSYGLIEVHITNVNGFSLVSDSAVNIGWLGGGHSDDPEPNIKSATFETIGLSAGDTFSAIAYSDKTGELTADFEIVETGDGLKLGMVNTNYIEQPKAARAYFLGNGPDYFVNMKSMTRSTAQIREDIERAEKKRKQWKRMEGPFDVLPGEVKGIVVKKYH